MIGLSCTSYFLFTNYRLLFTVHVYLSQQKTPPGDSGVALRKRWYRECDVVKTLQTRCPWQLSRQRASCVLLCLFSSASGGHLP